MERKLKHLEFIQGIINRLSQNSFLIKGWTLALVSAILAYLSSENISKNTCLITLIPILIFWILDGYYLWQENLFKELYNNVAKKEESEIDFLMNTHPFKSLKKSWIAAMFSPTLMMFYFTLVASSFVLVFLVLFPKT